MQHAGEESMFIFPMNVDHDRMFEALGAIRFGTARNWERKFRDGEAISAGFIVDGACTGESETLKLKSRPKVDTAIFNSMQKAGTV